MIEVVQDRRAERYQVDTARDDLQNLTDVLVHIATRPGHVRIVSIMWQPARGYTIVSEMPVED